MVRCVHHADCYALCDDATEKRKQHESLSLGDHTWERTQLPFSVDVSDIFYFFLLGGGERGSPVRQEGGGVDFFIEKYQGGVSQGRGRGGGRGAGRVSAGNLVGGGLNIFFRGRNSHPALVLSTNGMCLAELTEGLTDIKARMA